MSRTTIHHNPDCGAVRQKGTPYFELGLNRPELTDGELLDAMMAHSNLMNRPFVQTEIGVRLRRPSEMALEIPPTPRQAAFAREDGETVVDAQLDRTGR